MTSKTHSPANQGLHYYLSQGPTTWDFVLSDYLFIPSTKIQNGLQLVREIRAINPQQRMAIHTSEENLRAPVPMLHKPYQIGKLLRLLREPIRALCFRLRQACSPIDLGILPSLSQEKRCYPATTRDPSSSMKGEPKSWQGKTSLRRAGKSDQTGKAFMVLGQGMRAVPSV